MAEIVQQQVSKTTWWLVYAQFGELKILVHLLHRTVSQRYTVSIDLYKVTKFTR